MRNLKPKGRNLPIATLAEIISEESPFARDGSGLLYNYEFGVYRPNGQERIARRVKELAVEWGQEGLWNPMLASAAADYIRADAPTLWDAPPPNILNLTNGLLYLEPSKLQGLKPQLRRHSPKHLTSVQLPLEYDRQAQCRNWEEFVHSSFPADAYELAWEILAFLIAPTAIQKAVILTGEGANGKSAFLSGVTSFLGEDNVSNVSLHQLETDKFAVADLFGKVANICSDIPARKLFTTATFKAITGGDRIRGERKYRNAFFFLASAKLLFSANQLPPADDSTHAFARRLLIVPFERTFDEGAANTIPRSELDRKLSHPTELSGLLNKAIQALPRLRKTGFSNSPSVKTALDEYCNLSNPLGEWVEGHLEIAPELFVEKRSIIDQFNKSERKNQRAPMTDTAFGRALRRRVPDLASAQRKIDGRLCEVYIGIGRKPVKIFKRSSYS